MTETSASNDSPTEVNHDNAPEAMSWEVVSGRKRHVASDRDPRHKQIKVSDTIITNNRFEVLSNTPEDRQPANNNPIIIRPPPIHINDVKDYTALVTYLHNEGGPNSFRLKTSMRGVSVYPENAEIYRRLVTSLRRGGADFHTY